MGIRGLYSHRHRSFEEALPLEFKLRAGKYGSRFFANVVTLMLCCGALIFSCYGYNQGLLYYGLTKGSSKSYNAHMLQLLAMLCAECVMHLVIQYANRNRGEAVFFI